MRAPNELRQRGFYPKKSLGQHFLINPGILDQIVRYGELTPDDTAFEIGAGTGALTAKLAEAAGRVFAVETDAALLEELRRTCASYPHAHVIHADFLEVDVISLLAPYPAEHVCVFGNLPYHITSPILMKLLKAHARMRRCVLMVQWEVAQRLVAPPGSRMYGAPSVAVAYYTQARIVKKVAPGSFSPRPKVHSAILRLDMRRELPVTVTDEERFFRIVRGAFRYRRKTLRNALLQSGMGSIADVDAAIRRAELTPEVRPEKLSLEDFAQLTNALDTA